MAANPPAGSGFKSAERTFGRSLKGGLWTLTSGAPVINLGNMRSLLITVAGLGAMAMAAAAEAQQWRDVREYGLRIAFPVTAKACPGQSWTHLHGWGMPLVGDCERSQRRLVIWADWNSAFYRSPAEAALCSPQEKGSLVAGARLKLSFPGHPSATCLKTMPDGTLLVTVATQAWRWPDASTQGDADMRETAWVNYYGYLTTTRASLADDLRRFRLVLDGVQIRAPGG